jgi:hypothetical protein
MTLMGGMLLESSKALHKTTNDVANVANSGDVLPRFCS